MFIDKCIDLLLQNRTSHSKEALGNLTDKQFRCYVLNDWIQRKSNIIVSSVGILLQHKVLLLICYVALIGTHSVTISELRTSTFTLTALKV